MFDTRGVDTSAKAEEYPVLPRGVYSAEVGECTANENRKGNHQLVVDFVVRHQGKVVRIRQWFVHTMADKTPNDVGRKRITELARACNAVDSAGEPIPSAMQGNVVDISVKVRTHEGKERNEVDKIRTPGEDTLDEQPKRPGAHRYSRPDPTEGLDGIDTSGPAPDDPIPW